MNKTEVLGAFLLANIPEIITQEEFDDVKKAIKELQQENQELKSKIKTYEDTEDLTLMFMYCNEKAKGKIEELEKENLILREIVMIKKMVIPYKEINDKSLYDLYTIPSYSDLAKENQELKKQLKIKHDGFMASVDESCELAEEIQKYKKIIDMLLDLEQEKEELINYLKEQIKHIDDLITKGKPKPYGEELNLYENSKLRYLEILSKIEKSDK